MIFIGNVPIMDFRKEIDRINHINENYTISRYNLTIDKWRKFNSKGLTPYKLSKTNSGTYSLTKIKKSESHSLRHDTTIDRIFLIRDDKLPTIEKVINKTNEIIDLHHKQIELYGQHLIGVVDKLVNK